jgi:hypothetical protein
MGVYITPFVNVGVDTSAYADGDALGAKTTFTNVPEHGVIHSVMVIDRDKESVNLDLVLFRADFTGTAANAAFTVVDADLSNCVGVVLVDSWKAFADNSFGVVDSVGLPYWAPTGTLHFQCVTRGAPTYTAITDLLIAVSIIF